MAKNTNDENMTGAKPQQSVPQSPIVQTDAKGITSVLGTASTVFDVNKMLASFQDYLAINQLVNQMIGYDVKWFRAVPQQRSKDIIFQEYTLYNVEECPLDIKVVLPGGQFPDSKYTYDLMGLEYEVPLEIQIDKKYWESIAGFGTAPQKKDIVYFNIANKLYQVESTYLFRGFMEQETAWKLNLRKYMPEAARREGDALKETIDLYTVSTEEIFGGATEKEVAKLVDDKQFSQFNGTSKDLYKKVDPKLEVISSAVSIYGTVVAQSFYDMKTSDWFDAIHYNTKDVIDVKSNRAITAWVQPKKETNILYDVLSITSLLDDDPMYNGANYSIRLNSIPTVGEFDTNKPGASYIVISRPGSLNFYAKIMAITSDPLTFHCYINPFVLEQLNEIKEDWNLQKGYKLQKENPINIIDGENDFNDHVLSVNIFANQYIAVNYAHTYSNNDAYVIRLDEKLNNDEWYGIVVNIGNTWKQYNVCVWKQHETDKNAKLENIFYDTIKIYPEHIAIANYTINKSSAYLTNIRVFNETIEEEKQANELLSYFSMDGDKLIISDSADPLLRIPYISKQK